MAACQVDAMAICAKRDSCQDQLATRVYGSVSACVARAELACATSLGAPGQGNTPASVTACAATIASASCNDWQGPAGVCPQQKGTGADGSACEYAGQCTSGFCSIATGAPCGTCAAMPKAGDACTTTCGAQALACNRTTLKCVPIVAAGAKCDDTAECGPGLDCVGFSAAKMTSGTCQAYVATMGAPCDPTSSTGPSCDHDAALTCDKSKTCVPVKTATAGAPCGGDKATGDFTICTGGSACVNPKAAGAATTCQAYAMEGAACDSDLGPYCLGPANCIATGTGTAGTCKLPDPSACK
jgi:hypothetical protein